MRKTQINDKLLEMSLGKKNSLVDDNVGSIFKDVNHVRNSS